MVADCGWRWLTLLAAGGGLLVASAAISAKPKPTAEASAKDNAKDSGKEQNKVGAEQDDENKPLRVDLSKGPLIKQLATGNHMPKQAFAADETSLKPYVSAALGAPVAYTLANNAPLVRAPAMQRECDAIIATLLAHWDGPKPVVRTYVTSTTTYGANANDAGLILVNIGTFAGEHPVANRDELALLLAHELSHLLLLHRQESGLLPIISKALSYGGAAFSTYAMLKNSQYSNHTFTAKADEGMLLRSLGANAASSSLLLDILMPGRDRKREIDADMLGLDLAWRSGFRLKETDIDSFTGKNSEDEHARSQRMENMRAVMVLLISKATAKVATTATGTLGQAGKFIQPLAILGSNAVAEKLFDNLANSRKRHIDPTARRQLLEQYFQQNVLGQPFDVATEPAPKKASKKAGRVPVDGTAMTEANALITGARWAGRFEEASFAIYGAGLLADAAKPKESDGKASFFDKMKSKVMGDKKQAETQVAAFTKDLGAGSAAASAGLAIDPQAETMAKNKATILELIQQLARPGTINPSVPTSNAAAGRLATIMLHQEPRGQAYWSDGARGGYPIASLYRDLAASYVRTKNQARLPALASDYERQMGTIEPVIDVAVGAALVQGEVAEAEKLAARCLELSPTDIYPSCAGYLGYNPVGKGEKAKTPEGQQAFASARLVSGMKGILNLGSQDR